MNSNKGPAKGTKVRQNKDARTLSSTSKLVTGIGMLEHMGMLQTLKKDHLAALAMQIKQLRKAMKWPPLPPLDEDEEGKVLDADGKSLVYLPGTTLAMFTLSDEIVALRIYQKGSPPERVPVSEGQRWVDHNENLLDARWNYRENTGQIVTVGEEYAERHIIGKDGKPTKDGLLRSTDKLKRKGASPMRSITLRLMPHEARAVGEEGFAGQLTDAQLDRAIDRTVQEFEAKVGCEVVSAAVHRMRDSDLHIHIQYTMVLPVDRDEKQLKQAIANWHSEASEKARVSLEAENRRAVPAAVGKRIKEMVAKNQLDPEPTEVPADFEKIYQKRTALRSLNNKAILGYSLRFKLNLTRAIETARGKVGENHESPERLEELRQQVISKYDRNNGFRFKAAMSDEFLEKQYLDVWLERQWRSNVVDELPASAKEKLIAAGVKDARKYVEEGSTREAGQSFLYRHNADVAKRLIEAEEAVMATTQEIEKIEAKIKEIKGMGLEESSRLEKLASRVDDDKAEIFGELEEAWRDLADPEGLVAATGESPASQGDEETQEPTVSTWMTRIKSALGRKEKAVEKAAEERGKVGAWTWVITKLGAEAPVGSDAKKLETVADVALNKRVSGLISKGVSDGLAFVFEFFGKVAPAGKGDVEIRQDLVDAKTEYESGVRVEALRDTLGQIQGGRTPETKEMGEDGLKTQIQKEVGKFHGGVATQTRVALEGLTRHIFGNSLANYLIGTKKEEAELKAVLKDEYDRLRQADLQLEQALNIIKQNDATLGKEAGKIIDARPKAPEMKKPTLPPPGKSGQGKGPKIGG
jgi:hypothetical protein